MRMASLILAPEAGLALPIWRSWTQQCGGPQDRDDDRSKTWEDTSNFW